MSWTLIKVMYPALSLTWSSVHTRTFIGVKVSGPFSLLFKFVSENESILGFQIQLSPDAELTLQRFLQYRKQFLSRIIPNDNAQLLTGLHFEKGIVGKALKGPICTSDFSGKAKLQRFLEQPSHEIQYNYGPHICCHLPSYYCNFLYFEIQEER